MGAVKGLLEIVEDLVTAGTAVVEDYAQGNGLALRANIDRLDLALNAVEGLSPPDPGERHITRLSSSDDQEVTAGP